MKTKNKLLLLLFFLIIDLVYAQELKSFFIEIPNKANIPIVTHHLNGVRKSYAKTAKADLNKLINKYKIYSCKRVFTKSKKQSLQHIYLIECDNLDLIDELKDNFKAYYPRIEVLDVQPLGIPDDYGTTGGFISEQSELDYIRAPEAWDITTGSKDVIIGVADTHFQPNHEDLLGTLSIEVNVSSNNVNDSKHHGSRVASVAGANTDNTKGISSIGYDSYIYAGVGTYASVLDNLSLLDGVKVLNASWGTSSSNPPTITPDVYDEIVNDRGVVVIAAAGNGNRNGSGDPNRYFMPASYKDVISVSSIGHTNKTWNFYGTSEVFTDHHEFLTNGEIRSHQHNDSIDIVAPGYALLSVSPQDGLDRYAISGQTGTSYSAPIVAGTVALMFDVNYCIDPKEVETILKLTAVKIDTLPQNIQYFGKLGAGKLDAYEAVKMAKDMAEPFGTVEVKNRILYRPWFYKLVTAPYEIKMTNNDVSGGAKLKFRARNNVEILSGDYKPSSGGYIDLQIDETLALDCDPPPTNTAKVSRGKQYKSFDGHKGLTIFPNPTHSFLNVTNRTNLKAISIADITGKVVYMSKVIEAKTFKLDMSKFNTGVYFITIKVETGEHITKKIIKK